MVPSEPRGAIRWESTDPGQSGQKRVEARILGRVVKTRGPSLLKRRRFSKPKKLNFQFLFFFIFFLFLFGLERETPSLSLDAISGDVAPPGTAAVATDRRRLRLASDEKKDTNRWISSSSL